MQMCYVTCVIFIIPMGQKKIPVGISPPPADPPPCITSLTHKHILSRGSGTHQMWFPRVNICVKQAMHCPVTAEEKPSLSPFELHQFVASCLECVLRSFFLNPRHIWGLRLMVHNFSQSEQSRLSSRPGEEGIFEMMGTGNNRATGLCRANASVWEKRSQRAEEGIVRLYQSHYQQHGRRNGPS